MGSRFEALVVEHCAATLAGHKCASLFCFRQANDADAADEAKRLDRLLKGKGVRVRLLKRCPGGALVYVYRPKKLQQQITEKDTAAFLLSLGYAPEETENCLERLSMKLWSREDFPHEMGVFLGYPLHDVKGFILHHGQHYCCKGCWKAYANAEEAERRFTLYRRCQKSYLNFFHKGFDVARLTVAA